MEQWKGRDNRTGRVVNRTIFAAAVIVFAVAAVRLVQIGWDYYSADKEYDELQKYVQRTEENSDIIQESERTEHIREQDYAVDFEGLQKENPDCIGWIRFPNLDISYPIMQGKDNEEYLRHTFWGEYATAGSIFIDSANEPDFSDENTFVYGHNMKNGSMFGQLKYYEEEAFYKKNPGFYIETPKGSSYYAIFSCYLAAVEGQEESFAMSFSTEEEYGQFLDTVKGHSLYDTGIKPSVRQNTVTLLTCNQAGYDYRFLIHAVRTEFVPADPAGKAEAERK